jgi:hypothetical protein
MGWTMAQPKARKSRFKLLGYGAIGIYVAIIAVGVGAMYGVNITSAMLSLSRSEQVREQMRTGRMVITTGDRVQCRSLRFDNETSEMGAETMIDCADAHIGDGGGSLNTFHNGFTHR